MLPNEKRGGGPQTAERDASIDRMRAIACVMVVLIHVSSPVINAGTSPGEFHFANILDGFSRVAVPLFVAISGALLLTRPIDDLRDFYRRALFNIGIPTAAWSAIYLGVQYLQLMGVPPLPPIEGSILRPLKNAVLGGAYYHLWYPYMLIGLYLAAPIVERAWRTFDNRQRTGLLIGSAALALLNTAYRHATGNEMWLGVAFLNFLPYFFLGGLTSSMPARPRRAVLLVGYCAATLLTILGAAAGQSYFKDYLSISTFIAATCLFVALRRPDSRHAGALTQVIAKHSFVIYLVHPLFLAFSVFAFENNLAFVILPVVFVSVFIASLLFAMLLSRTRMRKVLGR